MTYSDAIPTDAASDVSGQSLCVGMIPLELPQGLELTGKISRRGQMRLATGADELAGHQAAERMDSAAYGVLVRLSRVIALSDRPSLSPDDLGELFMPDLTYLIDFYNDINPPDCELSLLGEFRAIP